MTLYQLNHFFNHRQNKEAKTLPAKQKGKWATDGDFLKQPYSPQKYLTASEMELLGRTRHQIGMSADHLSTPCQRKNKDLLR